MQKISPTPTNTPCERQIKASRVLDLYQSIFSSSMQQTDNIQSNNDIHVYREQNYSLYPGAMCLNYCLDLLAKYIDGDSISDIYKISHLYHSISIASCYGMMPVELRLYYLYTDHSLYTYIQYSYSVIYPFNSFRSPSSHLVLYYISWSCQLLVTRTLVNSRLLSTFATVTICPCRRRYNLSWVTTSIHSFCYRILCCLFAMRCALSIFSAGVDTDVCCAHC